MRHGVLSNIKAAAKYYGLPVDLDCVLHHAAAPRASREETPADSVPTPLLLGMERLAEGGVLHALGTDYVRAFLLLIALRARLGDMLSARHSHASTCMRPIAYHVP